MIPYVIFRKVLEPTVCYRSVLECVASCSYSSIFHSILTACLSTVYSLCLFC